MSKSSNVDKNGLGEYQTMISRHFLIIYNPFWRSSDFLDTFGPSRSVCRSRSKDFPPILSFFLDPQKYLKHSGFKWLESAKMYSLDVISQKFSNQVSADSLNFCFRSLSVLLTSFCYKAQLCEDEMRNLMKTNDLQQFPSPTESHELNAPHGGLWRSLRQSTDTKGQDLPLRRRPRQIFQIVTCLFKTRA